MNDSLHIKDIVQNYNVLDIIWDKKDKWHYHVYSEIKAYLNKIVKRLKLKDNILVLNAGSGGEEYGLTNFNHIHLDIVDKNIKYKERYIVSSIENIPIEDNYLKMVICVGSVLNYSDALQSLSELSRVMTSGGYLVLEFESSGSFEYMLSSNHNKSAAIIKTFYHHKEEKLWIYSEKYIRNLLKVYQLEIIDEYRFHIVSGFVYKLTKKSDFASKFTSLDKLFYKLKIFNKFSTNIIFTCQKT